MCNIFKNRCYCFRNIRIDEPTDFGIIVSGIQPIEAGFCIVEVATVAEGIDVCNMVGIFTDINTIAVGDGSNVAPLVVGVTGDECACAIGDAYNVVLCVSDIVELLVVVVEGVDVTFSIGVEADAVVIVSKKYKYATVVVIELRSNTVDSLGDSLSACIVARGNAPSKTPFDNQTEGIPPFGIPLKEKLCERQGQNTTNMKCDYCVLESIWFCHSKAMLAGIVVFYTPNMQRILSLIDVSSYFSLAKVITI